MVPKLCQAQLRAPPGSKDRGEGSLGQEVWGGPHTVGVPRAFRKGAAIAPAQRGRGVRSCHHGNGREVSGVAWQPGLRARGASGGFGTRPVERGEGKAAVVGEGREQGPS